MPINSPTENLDAWLAEVTGSQSNQPKVKEKDNSVNAQMKEFKKETEAIDKRNKIDKTTPGVVGEYVYEDLQEKMAKVRKAERNLREAAENQNLPVHSELVEVYDNATNADKLKITYELVRKAFEQAGTLSKDPTKTEANTRYPTEKGFEEITLRGIEDRDPTKFKPEDWKKLEKGGPHVFFHEIPPQHKKYGEFDPRGWFQGGEPKQTGEVVVYIVEDNAKDPKERTVVTMAVKHQGGKLLWGDNHPAGLYNIRSEAEFQKSVGRAKRGKGTVEDNLCAGNVTIDNYKFDFRQENENGLSYDNYIKQRDLELTAEPSDKDPNKLSILERRRLLREDREALMGDLSNEYTERLQWLRQGVSELIEQANNEMEELLMKQKEILNSTVAKRILTGSVRKSDKVYVNDLVRMIATDTSADIDFVRKVLGV